MSSQSLIQEIRSIAEESHQGVEVGACCSCSNYHKIIDLCDKALQQREITETDCPECIYKKLRKNCVDMGIDPDKMLNAPKREYSADELKKVFSEGYIAHVRGHRQGWEDAWNNRIEGQKP